MKEVLIIGGGPAGMGAAEILLSLGKKVTLLDIAPFVGGVPLELSCKGDVECTRCHVCMPRDAAFRMSSSEKLEVLSNSSVKSASIGSNKVELEIEKTPRYVNPSKCIACGKCIAVCPIQGALVAPPHGAIPNAPYIDPDLCGHFKSKGCDLCVQVCPTDAFNFREKKKTVKIQCKAVILSTGLDPIDPSGVLHYNYGILPNVLTSLDAERIIVKHGELRRPSDGQKPKKIAIVQCVGSRTMKGGVEYCSKFCCKYGLRIARSFVERAPDAEVDFLYMDLRTFEPRTEALEWTVGKKNVKISQGVGSIVQRAEKDNLLIRKTNPGDESIEEGQYDMVILSIGGQPRPETKVLAARLSLEVDSFGFVSKENRKNGVYVAGSCKSPMDIEESFADGKSIAFAVIEQLEVKK